jgi:hypothetical protein
VDNIEKPFSGFVDFGLKMKCEKSLMPVYLQTEDMYGGPDVVMYTGSVPKSLEKIIYQDSFIIASINELILSISGVARYLIRNGREIIVMPEDNASCDDVSTFTFGSALGTVLHQRGILAIHGSAVLTSKGAVIFTGNQGAGKSTMAAMLSKLGWPFLSDDICAVRMSNGMPTIYPGLTNSKLKNDSYEKIIGDVPAQTPHLPLLKKFYTPYSEPQGPVNVYAMCNLSISQSEPSINPVNGAKRFRMLVENTYRPHIQKLYINSENVFNHYTNMCTGINFFEIKRSSNLDNLDNLAHLIEEHILK